MSKPLSNITTVKATTRFRTGRVAVALVTGDRKTIDAVQCSSYHFRTATSNGAGSIFREKLPTFALILDTLAIVSLARRLAALAESRKNKNPCRKLHRNARSIRFWSFSDVSWLCRAEAVACF